MLLILKKWNDFEKNRFIENDDLFVYTLMLNMLSIYSMSIQLISISTPLGIDYHDKLVKRDTIDSSLASSPSISSTSFFSTAGSSLVSNPRFNHLFPHSFIVSLNIPTRD